MSKTKSKVPSKAQAQKILWRKGQLRFKLHPLQKIIYDQFYENPDDYFSTMLIARQTGKSYILAILAIEFCIRKPDSVVKFVTPTLKMIKNILNKNMRVILKDCPADIKPEWMENDKVWRFPNGSEIQAAATEKKNYDNIRGGTCLAKDTKILTKSGIKEIQNIEVGDIVYGYNEDGSISETKVLINKHMGKQKVTDIMYKGQSIGAATDDHVFLTNSKSSVYRDNPKNLEKRFGDINPKNSYIVREFVLTSGTVEEPHAYAIGAYIGDGCKAVSNSLRISSKDSRVPDKVASTIGCKVQQSGKFLYYLTSNSERYKKSDKITFNYYNDWLKGKNYLEKNFDFDVVNTWDRSSCLKLLAGLHDTDGNLYVGKDHCDFEYTSCNLSLIENINKLILKLFQVEGHVKVDNRSTVPCYKLKISSNLHVSRMVSELEPFVALKYKANIDKIYNSSENKNAVKITKGNSYITDTYDIMVDNDTNLYLTAHGLVTHNCDLWIVDEAGFCSDLEDVVYSVLTPTTTMTDGRGLLSSTPDPNDPDHPFIKIFVAKAKLEGKLSKYTIDDNPMLNKSDIAKIISRYPKGRKNLRFRAEYLCEIVKDHSKFVISEFDDAAEKETVTDQIMYPGYFDYYLSMDIGGKDFTSILIAYYDFINDTIVVVDEIVHKEKQGTKKIAKSIYAKIEEHFEEKPPYMMYADNNNIILLNDLRTDHKLNFIPTKKDNKQAAINKVKLLISNRQLVIHPRCKTLIAHLKTGKWADHLKNGYKEFAKDIEGGHYDSLDALIYLVRNIVRGKNPYPKDYSALGMEHHFQREREASGKGKLARLFKIPKSIKINK